MTRCLGGAPCVAMVLALCAFDAGARGQAPARTELANAGLEQGSPGEAPTGWFFSSSCGGKASIDADEPFAGAQSALIDASAPTGSGQLFSNLMQSLDAQPWRGKRVRFRAAVRTAELAAGAAAQLWFRVDRPDAEGGGKQYGAFDNMGDRPIRAAAWAPYDIVLQVAADAERIVCGMFVTGKGKAWLDDASLAVVDESVATTGEAAASAANSRMHPAVRRAFGEAENAPRQPFFTPWLWLPVFALLTFAVALWPMRRRGDVDGVVVAPPGRVRWFAIRFTIAYWLLYCLPSPFAQLLPWLGPQLGAAHGWLDARLVALVARSVFGIEADLVPPNGSGDTTWSYISTLNGFVLAVLVAAIWSAVGRVTTRRLDHVVLLDLLRSYLRYVLAFAMLGYGLAKVSMGQNQFSVIGDWQLKQTWGDCSPMGVVWKFMGASRPYTIFAGLGEVLAALLLIWRRTCSLGALVAIAVMSNVVMLNFCYDVPVKLYSSHLLLMAILIVMPDAARLCGVLVLNRATTVPAKRDLWMGPALRWVRRVVKAIVILYGFAWPVGNRVVELASHFAQAPEQASDDGTAEAGSRLTRRGFRWINEVPFNR